MVDNPTKESVVGLYIPPSEMIFRLSYLAASLSAPSEWVMIVMRFFCCQEAQQAQRCCAGIDKDSIPIGYIFGCQAANQGFINRVETGPDGRRDGAGRYGGGYTAINFGNVPAHLKFVQIAADGVFGNAEDLTQLVNADGLT